MNPIDPVLTLYPADVAAGPWEAVSGGLSGAKIWRSPNGWRLKAWPDVSAEHLRQTHVWMRHAVALDFVPRVAPMRTGETVACVDGWQWDVVSWMPGEPLLRDPTPTRLAAAGRALAALHVAWQSSCRRSGPCPAVLRRFAALKRIPEFDDSPARPAVGAFRRKQVFCFNVLSGIGVDSSLHPCLCDVRTDHVLFTRDRVTGLIDFGAAQIDHPAVDLARLLGDCLPGEPRRWQPLLDAYHSIRPLTPNDHALIAALEKTGAVVSLLTWIDRIRQRPLTAAEQDRLNVLVQRCESM